MAGENLFYDNFSHIYVEEGVGESATIDRLPGRTIIPVKHYKDVFNRPGQEFLIQKQSQKLILARRRDNFLYEGSPMCERFGHSRFYYATMMMNCPYNCAYCYLQTMYTSANIVAFVNPEDYFPAVEAALPAYVSISYDSDILALENIFGYVKTWTEFTRCHPSLTLEVRTKSANFGAIADISPVNNMILAWTVSPQSVIDEYEEKTPALASRIENIKAAMEKGWNVRLCFDPVLPLPGWEGELKNLLDQLRSSLKFSDLYDTTTGTFRMSETQYKKLRRLRPCLPQLSVDAVDIKLAREIIGL